MNNYRRPSTLILGLGCSSQKRLGTLALDNSPHSPADVICDLDIQPFRYSSAEFALRTVEIPLTPGTEPLKRLMFRSINRHIDFYEHHLAFVLPRHLIYYELEVIKSEATD